jgi:hypothetical protein
MHVWTVDEIYDLLYDVLYKNQLAEYLELDRPYTRIKKEEFAQIVCDTANKRKDLSDWIIYRRDQYHAKREYYWLYHKYYNTLNSPKGNDWVIGLKKLKEEVKDMKPFSNISFQSFWRP